MEHVSTLCAISTLGIAPTGFALGRAERASRPAPSRQSTLPSHSQHAPSPDTLVTSSSENTDSRYAKSFTTAGVLPPVKTSFPEAIEYATLETDQVQDASPRRKSSFAGVRLRRRGQTLTLPPLRADENPPASAHARRPSSSWIRRLSFQPEKRFSIQDPVTPSFPEPGSSASPRPSSQRRVPNKLVKRPKPQHSNANPLFSPTSSFPPAPGTLRRPATSYQRSEALKHKATHSLSFEPSLALSSPVEPTNGTHLGQDTWRPYIISSSADAISERAARRFSAAKPKEQGLRRIIAPSDAVPTLLLATSITEKERAREVTLDEPSTTSPVEFRNPFEVDNSSPQQRKTHSQEAEAEPCLSPSEETCPRSSAESAAPLDIRVFRNGSFVGPKRRAISTPLPELSNVEGAIVLSPRVPRRRNITDPNVFRRPQTTPHTGFPAVLSTGIMGSQRRILPSYYREYSTDLGQYRYRDFGQRALTDSSALSSLPSSIRQRPKRHSIAASDPASTVLGSDDTRIFTSGDEDETDFLSDTAFDSIRTHITTDSAYLNSPRIETIFDRKFAPEHAEERPLDLGETVPSSSFVRPLTEPCNPKAEREASSVSVLAPVTLNLTDVHEADSDVSFPSDLTDDEDSRSMVASLPGDKINLRASLPRLETLSLGKNGSNHGGRGSTSPDVGESTERDSGSIKGEARDSSPRMNIFDWSEQPKNDREGSGADGRPRTVHGKNGSAMRGSRAHLRKAPSALHYRSQSVPVAREPTAPNESRQTSGKFGTWGLGSKGVSEDWDSDFEFEDPDEDATNENVNPNKSVGRRNMIVPQAIMERQASLHGQFGQVQELTLLVEELKRLRHQASFLNIVRGPSSELWKEAEGIVDLATVDDEDNNHSPPRSPSSLTFSFDDSEGESSNANDPWKRVSGDSWRVSISEQSSTRPTTSPGPDHRGLSTKANSVLDLIYQQRHSHDPTYFDSHLPRSKKLPFDTQSLRDLVVRAGVVTRALKEVVRKAEGVTTGSEENTHPPQPPFSRIFEQPSHDDLSKFETSCIS